MAHITETKKRAKSQPKSSEADKDPQAALPTARPDFIAYTLGNFFNASGTLICEKSK